MVDSLRAALRLLPAVRRLLPAVRPGIEGTSIGLCSRVSRARIQSASEQSSLLALKVHPQFVNCEKALPGGTGIVRLARSVLAYVGAGLSAVTANQLAGPSVLQAKELGSSGGRNHTTGALEAGVMWQRTSASRHIVQEDVIRSPKLVHSPLPHIVSKSQADACYTLAHSYYWNNGSPVDVRFSPDAKLDSQWQCSPSTYRDHRSKLGGCEDGLNSRFSKPTGLQALTADSSFSLKSNAGPMGSVADYSVAAELEWQFIVDPKSKAGLETPISDGGIGEKDEEVTFEVARHNSRQDEPENIEPGYMCEVGSVELATKSSKQRMAKHDKQIMTKNDEEIMTKNDKEIMTKSCNRTMAPLECLHGDVDKQHHLTSKLGPVFQESNQHQGLDSRSSIETSLSWQTTDKEGSNLLGAPMTEESFESCELPNASAKSLAGMPLSTFDIVDKEGYMVRPADKNLLTELLHGNLPTWLENSGLPSSVLPGTSEPTAAAPVHFQTVTIPSVVAHPPIKCGSSSLSADNRNTSWNGGGALRMTSDRGSGLLGEALCHSQTRAREAEKQVQQAFEEHERLVRLVFREASQTLTYRHWVTSLQIENMWLRKFAPNESLAWFQGSFVGPFSTMGHMTSRSWKEFGKNYYAHVRMEHNVSAMHEKDAVDLGQSSSNNIVMGCTLGLAFALGLSLAGAGLVIGWSMGWILLAYSVSV